MKDNNTIKLYSVMCGLLVDEQVFSPYPNIDFNYYPDLDKVKSIYNGITGQSFDKKEVMLTRLRGFKTYTKYITQIEMPIDFYNEIMEDEEGFERTEKERQEHLNCMVFSDEVNFDFENVRDEVFELTYKDMKLRVSNLRQYELIK